MPDLGRRFNASIFLRPSSCRDANGAVCVGVQPRLRLVLLACQTSWKLCGAERGRDLLFLRATNCERPTLQRQWIYGGDRTLPFGSQLTVANPDNGKSVTVGPFTRGVAFDLSRGAARAIGMSGTQWVCML